MANPALKGRGYGFACDEMIEGGASIDEVLEAYPVLSRAHVQSGLHLASQLVDNDRFVQFRAA